MKFCSAIVISCCLFILLPSQSLAQLTSTVISTDKCDYIQSNVSTNPNGTTATLFGVSTYWSPRGSFFRRGFVEFDVSSIPTNAIIYEAELEITHVGATYVSNPWVAKLVTSSWTEGSITPSNQPNISNSSSDWSSSYQEVGSTVSIDVKNMVQRMVYNPLMNNGWSIQVSNEAATYASGTFFNSDENLLNQPRLLVKYYLPVTLSNVVISHESESNAGDAGITLSHTPLDPSGHSYNWINSSGTSIGTSQSLNGVSYGWYGLEITGTSNGEKAYLVFLVGIECEEVTINYSTRPEYTSNSYITDRVDPGGLDYRDVNYGNTSNFRTDNRLVSSWTDVKSYIDFNVWMDDAFAVNQADLLLKGLYHSNSGNENQSEVNEVTSYWNENLITWNIPPSNNSTANFLVPATTSTSQDATFDMKNLWDDWKQDNNANYGVLFQLQDFDDDANCSQYYHSPNTATSSKIPEWTFRLSLNDGGFECNPSYAELKRNLTGVLYKSVDDILYISFDSEYISSSQNLKYSIYHHTAPLSAVISGVSQPVSVDFGTNQRTISVNTLTLKDEYILEVVNDKDEKLYLRFRYD